MFPVRGLLAVLYFSIVFHLRMYRVDGVEEWKESQEGGDICTHTHMTDSLCCAEDTNITL